MVKNKPKILVIVGPTATGKSDLAIRLAKKFCGEIISADSRQVYQSMNIGTGKVTKKEMGKIRHYLLDVASPKKTFTALRYKKLAEKALDKIVKNNRLAIVCGGTGFYIRSFIDSLEIPDVPPNTVLRKKLNKLSSQNLFKILKQIDPRRAKNIDQQNSRRLIRAIEIASVLGQVPKLKIDQNKYKTLFIGLDLEKKDLDKKIDRRLLKRLKQGMIKEIKNLRMSGVSWKKLEGFGLEYKYISLYLQNKLDRQKMIEQLKTAIKQYAKRQITWFKKDKRINWFKPNQRKKIEKMVASFVD